LGDAVLRDGFEMAVPLDRSLQTEHGQSPRS
jgi:hypothetical protein